MSKDPIIEALRRAHALLEFVGVRGAVIGGVAVAVWGRPRATQDIDLIVELPEDKYSVLLEAAASQGYRHSEDDPEELLRGGFLSEMGSVPAHSGHFAGTMTPFPRQLS